LTSLFIKKETACYGTTRQPEALHMQFATLPGNEALLYARQAIAG